MERPIRGRNHLLEEHIGSFDPVPEEQVILGKFKVLEVVLRGKLVPERVQGRK